MFPSQADCCNCPLELPLTGSLQMLRPEVYLPEFEGKPYCPFKHDVYQLAATMRPTFQVRPETCVSIVTRLIIRHGYVMIDNDQ